MTRTLETSWANSRLDGGGWMSCIVADPRGGGVLLAGSDVAGVHRSVDNGQTWATSNSGMYHTQHLGVADLIMSPVNPDVVVALTGKRGLSSGGGVFLSTDNGRTWTQDVGSPAFSGGANSTADGVPGEHPRSTGHLAAIDTSRNILYVGSYKDGVWRAPFNPATGTLGTWTLIGFAGSHVRCLRHDTVGNRLYVGLYDGGLHRVNSPESATDVGVGGVPSTSPDGTWVLQQLCQNTGLAREKAIDELGVYEAQIRTALRRPGVVGFSARVPWYQMEWTNGNYDDLDDLLAACKTICDEEGKLFSFRLMAGRWTPQHRLDAMDSAGGGSGSYTYLASGERVPKPFRSNGTAGNPVFEAAYQAIHAHIKAWSATNGNCIKILHMPWYGWKWAEIMHGTEITLEPGYSYAAWRDGHYALIDIAESLATSTLPVEFPMSGHFAQPVGNTAALNILDRFVAKFGSWSDRLWVQGNGHGEVNTAPNQNKPIFHAKQMHGTTNVPSVTYGLTWAQLYALLPQWTNRYLEVYLQSFAGGESSQLFAAAAAFAPPATVTNLVSGSVTMVEDLLLLGDYAYLASSNQDGSNGGVWRAKINGTGANDTSWTDISGPIERVESRWVALAGEIASGNHRIYTGCTHSYSDKIGGVGPFVGYTTWRCDTAQSSPTWTCLTHQADDDIPRTVGGPTGPQWWLAPESPWAMLGRPSYFVSQLEIGVDGRLWQSGRSGVWATDNPTASAPTWYPFVRGIAATINRQVTASTGERVLVGNTDHVALWTDDRGDTWTQNKPTPNTTFATGRDLRTGEWLLGTGDRDDPSILGRLHSSVDLADIWTDERINPAVDRVDTFLRDIIGGTNPWGAVTPATAPATNWGYSTSGTQSKDNMGVDASLREGFMGLVAGNGILRANHPDTIQSPRVTGTYRWDGLPAGAVHSANILLRRNSGTDSHYLVRVRTLATNAHPTEIQIFKQTGGSLSSVLAVVEDLALSADVAWDVIAECYGTSTATIRVKVFEHGTEPPADWTVTYADSSSPFTTGTVSLQAQAFSGYTGDATLYWSSLVITDLAASAGGVHNNDRRVIGAGMSTQTGDGRVIVACVEDGGILRKTVTGWEATTGGPTFAGQSSKTAAVWWPINRDGDDDTVFVLDRATGVWRSLDAGASWTLIFAVTTDAEFTGYLAGPQENPAVVFVSAARKLYRIDQADSGSPIVTEITPPGGNIGAMTVGSDGTVYATRNTSAGGLTALWAGDGSGTDWQDQADDVYRGAAGWTLALSVSDDGHIYAATFGQGVLVGTLEWSGGGGGVSGPPRPLWYPPVPPHTTLPERLRQSHRVFARFELRTPYGEPISRLWFEDASVTWDASAVIRGRFSGRLVDHDGTLLGRSGESLLFGNEVACWYGVEHADGRVDETPCGVFVIGAGDVTDDGVRGPVQVTAMDRARRVQRSAWTSPFRVPAGTSVADGVRQILAAADATISRWDLVATAHQTTDVILGLEDRGDPWQDAVDLAATAGCDLWMSRVGVPTMALVPDTEDVDVAASWVEGDDAVVTQVGRRLSSDETFNGVLVIAEGTGVPVPFQAAAWDTDPDSPTFWLGPFGRAPRKVRTQAVSTVAQARDMAASELLRSMGAAEQTSVEVAPDPTLDVRQLVRLRRPQIGVDGTYSVERITLPFDGKAMQVGMRERRVGVARASLIAVGGGL